MSEPEDLERELEAARLRYPIGDHVTGTITSIPRPGAIGIFVDLGAAPTGFVDVLHLPLSVGQWPVVGTTTDFEVLQHRHGQVRLWPLDGAFRSSTQRWPMSEAEWHAAKSRHPVGSEVVAKVTHVFPGNREYVVAFDGVWSDLSWTGTPPTLGAPAHYMVDRHLDATRRIRLRPLPHNQTRDWTSELEVCLPWGATGDCGGDDDGR